MSETVDVRLPDIGDFADVEVIEVIAEPGARVERDAPLVVIESDKASIEVPAPVAGEVREIAVKVGDRISTGDLLARIETADAGASAEPTPPEEGAAASTRAAQEDAEAAPTPEPRAPPRSEPAPSPAPAAASRAPARPEGRPRPGDERVDVLVLGSGPGGYTAAFRAADLGLSTVLVERFDTLGGVCLNVGCIPSKALLHAAGVLEDARGLAAHGIELGQPSIDLAKLARFKDGVVERLTKGLTGLARQRKVQVLHGVGEFVGPNELRVRSGDRDRAVAFEHAIVAAGSESATLPDTPDDPRIIDSTGALALEDVPQRLLVVGGGIIGLEMATVYAALGSRVTVVELLDRLMAECDADLVRPLQKRLEERLEGLHLGTRVGAVKPQKRRVRVELEGEGAPGAGLFDKVLVAIGRRPNGGKLGLDAAGVHVDERGFIPVDDQQRTNVPHIFAIGDVCGQPMLAHKATHEAKVAAEVIAGAKRRFEPLGIPSVAYTDPEVAWVGVREEEARGRGIEFDKTVFPWAASGRALGMDRAEGFTKLLFGREHGRLIGAGIVGRHAGDLISEAALALELGADAEDIGLTIHPHPTLSETLPFAAEMLTGSITDLLVPPRKRKG